MGLTFRTEIPTSADADLSHHDDNGSNSKIPRLVEETTMKTPTLIERLKESRDTFGRFVERFTVPVDFNHTRQVTARDLGDLYLHTIAGR